MTDIYSTPHLYKQVWYENTDENLTGFVDGKDASDLEERFARALVKLAIPSQFRARVNPLVPGDITKAHRNILGEVEIDFLANYMNRIYAILIDGEIAHFRSEWQKEVDAEKTFKINTALAPFHAKPVIRIPYWYLSNQLMANAQAEEIFLSQVSNAPPPASEDKLNTDELEERLKEKELL